MKSNRLVAKRDIDHLDLATRVRLEAAITDARSQAIAFEAFQRCETRLERYVGGAPWRQYLFNYLGPVAGRVVLDVACGYSMTPVMLALAGATVYAVDVAPQTVATVQRVAVAKGVGERVKVHVGPAEALPFADKTFDLIFGGAALHHLRLELAGPEFYRVLKPGGRGGFQDPLGHNPLLEFVRDYLPYKAKHPVKGTDRPLHLAEVRAFGRHFTHYHYHGFDLLAMVAKSLRLKPHAGLRQWLYRVDNVLFHALPACQRYARFVVTCVSRAESD